MINGVTADARSVNPNVRIEAVSSNRDPNKQAAQIDGFIAAGVDVIILDPVDHDAMLPAIRRAQRNGIAVVAVHFLASGVDAAVGTDDVAAGRLSCQALATLVGGKGNVIIESGPQRISAVGDRVRGCREALAAHPAVTLLSFDGDGKGSKAGGLALTTDDLARYPAVAGVFTISEPEAMGAQEAMTRAGRRNIVITTVGGAPDAADALRAPGGAIAATAALDPFGMGELAMKDGASILSGQRPARQVTLTMPRLVDRTNVGDYPGWMRH